MITINGIELNVDFTDADVQERYNDAQKELQAANYDGLDAVGMTRKAAQNVRAFIDGIYGIGIGVKVLPRDSGIETMRAVELIVGDANAQFAEVAAFGEKFNLQAGNRAARRAKK